MGVTGCWSEFARHRPVKGHVRCCIQRSSFYVAEHDFAHSVELSLHHEGGVFLVLDMSMDVDFSGLSGHDANPNMGVKATGTIPFQGVWFRPDNFAPPPSNEKEALAIADQFLDLDDFAASYLPGGTMLMAPRF